MHFTYVGNGPPVTWVDRIIVARQRGQYVIADVEYGGHWDYANSGTLRTSVEQGLAAALRRARLTGYP